MTPEKYKELRVLVKALIQSEMRLLETLLIKRVMLALEYADSIDKPGEVLEQKKMELSSSNEKLSNSSKDKPM